MDHKSEHLHTSSSSLRLIGAFGDSFSCSQFGAADLDLDEDDFEAIALEAEITAQERIHKAKQRELEMNSLLEFESDDFDGSSKNGKHNTKSEQGGTEKNSMKPEPSKILKNNDEQDISQQKRQTQILQETDNQALFMSNDTPPHSSGVNEHSGNPNARDLRATVERDEKSETVVSTSRTGAAIHISSPNVVINYNYVMEENKATTAGIGFVATSGNSGLSLPQDGSNIVPLAAPSLDTKNGSTDSIDGGKQDFRGPTKVEGAVEEECSAQQTTVGQTLVSTTSPQTKPKLKGSGSSNLDFKPNGKNSLANTSNRRSSAPFTPDMSASLSTNTARTLPQRSASEKNIMKPTIPERNLSKMLDSLNRAKSKNLPVSRASTDSRARRNLRGSGVSDCGNFTNPQSSALSERGIFNCRSEAKESRSSTLAGGEGLQSTLTATKREGGERDKASRRRNIGQSSNPRSISRGGEKNASRFHEVRVKL